MFECPILGLCVVRYRFVKNINIIPADPLTMPTMLGTTQALVCVKFPAKEINANFKNIHLVLGGYVVMCTQVLMICISMRT